jgi:hypothetical protein
MGDFADAHIGQLLDELGFPLIILRVSIERVTFEGLC